MNMDVILESIDQVPQHELVITVDKKIVHRPRHSTRNTQSSVAYLQQICIETFLPNGFPASVKKEYAEYQVWDSVQGLCSYLRSVVTTRSLLLGAGLDKEPSVALSAAISWVLRDGFGMLGGLVIAYLFAPSFEVYTKEWRLVADLLNNIGLFFDLITAVLPSSLYFPTLVVSSISKAGCGLIAGATKSRISAHFAAPGHLADVCAKESTQETAVALLGLLLSSWVAHMIGDREQWLWSLFMILTVLHVYCNYRLVTILVFQFLNNQRAWLLCQEYHHHLQSKQEEVKVMLSPQRIASLETLWRPLYLEYYGPQLGVSLHHSAQRGGNIIFLDEQPFILIWHASTQQMAVALSETVNTREIVRSYLTACLLQQELSAATTQPQSDQELQNKAAQALHAADDLLIKLQDSEWDVDSSVLSCGKWRYSTGAKDKNS